MDRAEISRSLCNQDLATFFHAASKYQTTISTDYQRVFITSPIPEALKGWPMTIPRDTDNAIQKSSEILW